MPIVPASRCITCHKEMPATEVPLGTRQAAWKARRRCPECAVKVGAVTKAYNLSLAHKL